MIIEEGTNGNNDFPSQFGSTMDHKIMKNLGIRRAAAEFKEGARKRP